MNDKLPDRLTKYARSARDLYEAETAEEDLWFLPGPADDDPPYLPPLPRAEIPEASQIAEWDEAQANLALKLATVATRLGALTERLRTSPEGWLHRLALIEATQISWLAVVRIAPDRLGLWHALRAQSVADDTAALERASWVFSRLTGRTSPTPDIATFLARRTEDDSDLLVEKTTAWNALIAATTPLHPITRACFAFYLWPLSGIGAEGDMLEGATIASRLGAGEGPTPFAPIFTGGATGMRGLFGTDARLERWLVAADQAALRATRHLDTLERWTTRAQTQAAHLSGKTPNRLIDALSAWPYLTAPMAEDITGASRAAVQRNLAWFETEGLIQEVTGQGRFRVWKLDLSENRFGMGIAGRSVR